MARPKLGATSLSISLTPEHSDWIEERTTSPFPTTPTLFVRGLIEQLIKLEKAEGTDVRFALKKVLEERGASSSAETSGVEELEDTEVPNGQ